jgi:hypothetical protein
VRCLFALSADFGEFATANLLSRGQPFERRFALPPPLAAQAGALDGAARYASADELRAAIDRERPDAVVLGSGYLYAVNGLFGPEALAALLAELRGRGIAVATTDPWLRLRALKPQARFAIHSVRRGGVDAGQSARVLALQRRLEGILGALPHVLAVPAPLAHGCFNPAFARPPPPVDGADEWLFVLSQQDLSYFPREDFLRDLGARLDELLQISRNRVRLVAPPALGRAVEARFAGERRVEWLAAPDFAAFEEAVLRSRVVAYWNLLSASALYCLYHGVAPVFFGRGHQAMVCEGLHEHALEHVYRGAPPATLELARPLGEEAHAAGLLERRGLRAWLERLRADYARLPALAQVLERLCSR